MAQNPMGCPKDSWESLNKEQVTTWHTQIWVCLGGIWASQQAAYVYRSCVIKAPILANAPTFGNRVLVRDIQGEQTSFAQKSK